MSRSFKKRPIIKIAPKNGKIGKKFANRKVRRSKEIIIKGRGYCKYFEQYDIHDYVCRQSYLDFRLDYESSLKEYANGIGYNPDKYGHSYYDWFKMYKRK